MPASNAKQPAEKLPSDNRAGQGGILFLVSLLIFFLASICLYGLYAYWRRDAPQSTTPLPNQFLFSTICLLGISGLVHWATRMVRRDRLSNTGKLLGISALLALMFMAVQVLAMSELLQSRANSAGLGYGVAGMIVVLAVLHGLHVLGGVVALFVVAAGAFIGRYDHERHWPIDFTAHYWHFLDIVWLCMLVAFWLTSGGFEF